MIRTTGLLSLVLLLAGGCADITKQTTDSEATGPGGLVQVAGEAVTGDKPVEGAMEVTAALLDDSHRLYLRYRIHRKKTWGTAVLPEAPVSGQYYDQPVHLIPDLPIVELGNESVQMPAGSAAALEVAVLPSTDWSALLQELFQDLVPQDPGQGIVLDILRAEELFLYRDTDGAVLTVPILFKPETVEAVDVMSLTHLLVQGNETVRQSLASQPPGIQHVLYHTGDSLVTGYPFVYLDLDRKSVHFIRRERKGEPSEETLPLNFIPASVTAVTGQLKSYIGQPVQSVTRLVTSIGTTAFDTLRPTPQWLLASQPVPPVSNDPMMDPDKWEQRLDSLLGDPGTSGKLRFLVDGERFFPRLIDVIHRAKVSLQMRLYIFDNDDYAIKIANFLKNRSQDISVRILLDGLGTVGAGYAEPGYTPGTSRERQGSVTLFLREQSNIALRVVANPWLQGDHTKAIIIDDETGFIGGMNIGREYRYEWHDMMVEASGPVINRIARDFEVAWKQAGPLGDIQALVRTPFDKTIEPEPEDYPLRVLYTKPGDSQILRAQVAAMRQARQRIWIENAYITSDLILYELIKARKRGVDVRVILPYENDSGIIDRSNALAANMLLRHGVRVYVYPGMSHIKAAIYDGWSCLGSANFDRLSLRLNKEMNLATSHQPAVDELIKTVFTPDFDRSIELTEPLPNRWYDYLMELIADQL